MTQQLPTEVIGAFDAIYRVDVAGFDKEMHEQINARVSQSVLAGGVSSRTCLGVGEIVKTSLAIRARAAFNVLLQCAGSHRLRIDEGFASSAFDFLQQRLQDHANALAQTLSQSGGCQTYTQVRDQMLSDLDSTRQDHLNKAKAQLALMVASAKTSSAAAGLSGGVGSIYVAGSVGVLQTGVGSSAVSYQVIDHSTRQHVVTVLENVERDVTSAPGTLPFDKAELLDVVREAKAEASKETPNKTKLGSLLTGIGGAISTTAALAPAYQAVKGVAAFFGITLP